MKVIAIKNNNYTCGHYYGADMDHIQKGTEFEVEYGNMYSSYTLVWFKGLEQDHKHGYNSCGFDFFIDGTEVDVDELRDLGIIRRRYL